MAADEILSNIILEGYHCKLSHFSTCVLDLCCHCEPPRAPLWGCPCHVSCSAAGPKLRLGIWAAVCWGKGRGMGEPSRMSFPRENRWFSLGVDSP